MSDISNKKPTGEELDADLIMLHESFSSGYRGEGLRDEEVVTLIEVLLDTRKRLAEIEKAVNNES